MTDEKPTDPIDEAPLTVIDGTPPDISPTDATDELTRGASISAQPPPEGAAVATRTRTRTTSKKRPTRSTKTAKRAGRRTAANGGAWEPSQGLPDPSSLRLARGGVAAGDGSSIQMAFANGYHVSLKVGGENAVASRDHLVGWLRKRLGADRT